MENKPLYFPKRSLKLKPAGPGAKMWGVALKKAQLTYFEVEPHSRFEMHSHESEQITLVLEGELFFEAAGETIRLGPGEVIALPSNLPHAAFTRDRPAKAVDAWSPILEKSHPSMAGRLLRVNRPSS